MKSQNFIYGTLALVGIVLIIAIVSGLYISNEISKASPQLNDVYNKKEAYYHVMVIVNSDDEAYKVEFVNGIEAASINYGIAYELVKVNARDYDEDVLDAVDMAVYAKVDGIIVDAVLSSPLILRLENALKEGIPVITVNEDLPQSNRISFVGVDKYNIGQTIGKTFTELLEGKGRIAVIEKKGYQTLDTNNSSKDDILVLGLTDYFLDYPDMHVEIVSYTEQGVLGAETVVTNILKEHPTINGIYCNDEKNTLGAIQVILDNNLVNNITLIGSGNDLEILDFITKGNVVEATIVKDDYDIGYKAIEAIDAYKNNRFVSSYINSEIHLLTPTNIEDYINENIKNIEAQN